MTSGSKDYGRLHWISAVFLLVIFCLAGFYAWSENLQFSNVHNGGPIFLEHYGDTSDFNSDTSSYLVKALKAGENYPGVHDEVKLLNKRYKFNQSISLSSWKAINLSGALVQAHSPDCAFDFGWKSGSQIGKPKLKGGLVYLNHDGMTGIKVQNSVFPIIDTVDVRLRGINQTAIKVKGHASPNGPYYGVIQNPIIRGSTRAGNIGIQFLPEGNGLATAEGVNSWKCIGGSFAVLNRGLDLQAGTGNSFIAPDFESIDGAAVYFGDRPSDYTGSVTATRTATTFFDSAIPDDPVLTSTNITILSGPNAGYSAPVMLIDRGKGMVQLTRSMPYNFALGDRYSLTAAKASNMSVIDAALENVEVGAYFGAGSRSCKMTSNKFALLSSQTYFVREIEDATNTIANSYSTYRFEGLVPAGGGTVGLQEDYVSGQGGIVLEKAGWIDSITVSGASRGRNSPGTIQAIAKVSGIPLPSDLRPVLTPDSPHSGLRVRKKLTPQSVIRPGTVINVEANGSFDLRADERVFVILKIGHF